MMRIESETHNGWVIRDKVIFYVFIWYETQITKHETHNYK